MLEAVTLLRGTTNLVTHDALFALVCHEVDWEFIPTTAEGRKFVVPGSVPAGLAPMLTDALENELCDAIRAWAEDA
jgi:hypothetical protein